MIDELTANELIAFIKTEKQTTNSEILKAAYKYWLSQDPFQTILELKHDFEERRVISMNDNPLARSNAKYMISDSQKNNVLNTLENPDNPIRVIFAVAKLTEGWDVLNLYDVVRISERKAISKDQTDSEAQLIGRGARYYPFIYQGRKLYTRRFDDQSLEYEVLERLYYHTINDSKYLKNLKKSLDEMNLSVDEDGMYRNDLNTEVKESFIRTNVYQHGNVYYNEVEDILDEEYSSLKDYGIDPNKITKVSMVNTTVETNYDDVDNGDIKTELRTVIKFKDQNDYRLARKGIAKNDFYRFDSLKEYIPLLHSLHEFIQDDNWLGSITLYAEVATTAPALTMDQRLKALSIYLDTLETKIKKNYQSQRGTNRFTAIPIREVVKPYSKRVSVNLTQNNTARIDSHPLNEQWYVYEHAIVDKFEWNLIQLIGEKIDQFTEKYAEVYLIRIEEQLGKLKLHDFGKDVSNYGAYMPDFVLYLEDKDYSYQIYVEPKGKEYVEKDRWKQDLLEKIEPENITILGENQNVKLYGVKFFLKNQEMRLFNELKEKKIID